ncbi:MAG: nitroreductase/quinone reductase family protein [Candidatus Binatia bacterium]
MIQRLVRTASRLHTSLFRSFGGSGWIGRNTLILTTRGRRSGREISTPLFHVAEGERLYVVASFGGNDEPPGWYKNLLADPEVTVEVGGRRGRYRARTLGAEETLAVWPKLLAMWPSYASYQKRTTRVIPVVELAPLG